MALQEQSLRVINHVESADRPKQPFSLATKNQGKIQECFNKNAVELLDKEIAVTEEFQVSGSPSLFINGTAFPPEGAYDQTGEANVQIGDQVFAQSEYRAPEAFKQAICAAFDKQPKECKQELQRTNEVGSGSCN